MAEVEIDLLPQQSEWIHSRAHDLVISGSAGSGKSKFAVFKTIAYCLEVKGCMALVTRKYGPSLNISCRDEIIAELNRMGIPYTFHKLANIITLFNGSRIHFKPVDVLGKFRSLEFDYIWIEQAEEINYYDYMELMRRLRGQVGGRPENYLQCIITATPEAESHWMYKIFYKPGSKYTPIHFDYKENYFLPEDYVDELEKLKEIDMELYNKYALGEWGKISNTIYPGWKETTKIPECDFYFAGADWGYNNPSAFILMGYDDDNIYIIDEVYKTELTNPMLLEKCVAMLKTHDLDPVDVDMWADPSEPDRLVEFSQEGFNVLPGAKQPLRRIDTVKRMNIYYNPETCPNVMNEVGSYKWMTDKDGNVLDRPVEFKNHAMDAIGYGLVGMVEMTGMALAMDPLLIVGGPSQWEF